MATSLAAILRGGTRRERSRLASARHLPENSGMRPYLYALAALLVPLAASCNGGSAPDVLPSGHWGGDHVGLDVTDTSTRIEFDCAHGTVDGPWSVGHDGNFDVSGQYVREHPGP